MGLKEIKEERDRALEFGAACSREAHKAEIERDAARKIGARLQAENFRLLAVVEAARAVNTVYQNAVEDPNERWHFGYGWAFVPLEEALRDWDKFKGTI